MILSIIIPVFNERNTILKLLNKIEKVKGIEKEVVIIDDCSDDGTKEILSNLNKPQYKVYFHDKNMGKGAAIKTAKNYISGQIIIIQDADLEYNPNDYNKLISPIINKKSRVVYGSRVLGKKKKKLKKTFNSPYIRIFGNYILTQISNFINNQHLTDAHTCYKVFSSVVFKKLKLLENDFAFCPEVTSLISKQKIKILEVPIDYKGRSIIEGKKIKFLDALRALYVLVKTNLRG